MLDDMEQKIKEMLLEELINKMSDGGAERMKPKGLGVEVQAADPEHLKEGLEKARDLVGKTPVPGEEADSDESMPTSSDEDDEQRLLQLLEEDDEDEDQRK